MHRKTGCNQGKMSSRVSKILTDMREKPETKEFPAQRADETAPDQVIQTGGADFKEF